jgi:dihydrofolate synthase/folylpolyglutamate synthase
VDYVEARRLLDRLPRLEVKPGLERIRRLVSFLDHPERAFQSVHVAGTNGKGSVVAMLASVLERAGYRVGRYTSPELVDYRDRFCVNGEWISEASFAARVERLSPILFSDPDVPSQFEAITAIAFDQFRAERIDVGVIEVGLGGRFDATNVIESALAILTTVDLDHTALLGESLEEIAWEKAGIARRGIPLLIGDLPEVAARVVRAECERVGARCVAADLRLSRDGDDGKLARYTVLESDLPRRLCLPLLGGYQLDNLRVVLGAVRALREIGLEISSSAVEKGLLGVRWPGRFEIVRLSPTVVLEGAHNVAGARALAKDIARLAPDRAKRLLLFGVLSDKDVDGMLDVLLPAFSLVAATQSVSPRAVPSRDLAARMERHSFGVPCYDSVEEGIRELLGGADLDDVLVVTGSLTVVAEARRALGVG